MCAGLFSWHGQSTYIYPVHGPRRSLSHPSVQITDKVDVDTALGMVFVNVDGNAPPLKEWLGDLLVTIEDFLPALENELVVRS
jgi:hypothetical protein